MAVTYERQGHYPVMLLDGERVVYLQDVLETALYAPVCPLTHFMHVFLNGANPKEPCECSFCKNYTFHMEPKEKRD